MKLITRACASASIVLGVVFLTWVLYDATSVLNAIGPQKLLDEAAVAVLTISLGFFFVLLGIRSLRSASRRATVGGATH